MFYSFLFSFQCPLTRLSRRVLIYTTIHFFFCKAFSLSFFIFFSLSIVFFPLYRPFFILSFFAFFLLLTPMLSFFSKTRSLKGLLSYKVSLLFWTLSLLFRVISLFLSTCIFFYLFSKKRLYVKKQLLKQATGILNYLVLRGSL